MNATANFIARFENIARETGNSSLFDKVQFFRKKRECMVIMHIRAVAGNIDEETQNIVTAAIAETAARNEAKRARARAK